MSSLDLWDHHDIEETLGELDSTEEELEYLDAKEGLTPGELEETMFEYHSVPGRSTSFIVGPDRSEDEICGADESRGDEIPALEETGILIPVTEPFASDHQVGNQHCVCSLGRFQKPAPYWLATGLRHVSNRIPGRRANRVPAARMQTSSMRPPPVNFSSDGDSKPEDEAGIAENRGGA